MGMKQDGTTTGWRFGDGMGYYFSKEGQELQYSELRRGYMRGQTDFDALAHLDFVHELSAEDMVPDDVILQTEERGFIMGWAARAYDAAQELVPSAIGNTSKPNPNLPLA